VLEPNLFDPRVGTVVELPGVPPPRGLVPEVVDPGCPGCLWLAAEGFAGLEAWRLRPDRSGTISPSSPREPMLLASEVRAVTGVAAGYEERTLIVAERRSNSVLRLRVGPAPRQPSVEKLADLRSRPAALASGCEGSVWVLVEREHAGDPGSSLLEIGLDASGRPAPARTAARFWGDPRGLAVDPIRGWLYALVREVDDFVVYELSPDSLGPRAALPHPLFSLKGWTEAVARDPSLLLRVTPPDQAAAEANADASTSSDKPKRDPKLRVLPTRLAAVAFDAAGSLYLTAEDSPMVLRFHLGRPWVGRNRAFVTAVPVRDGDGGMRLRLLSWALPLGAGAP
jgi:hypothetical protein